ncbi:MAG: hypothetical protein EOO74_12400, partial [Myxococcales bacterium]
MGDSFQVPACCQSSEPAVAAWGSGSPGTFQAGWRSRLMARSTTLPSALRNAGRRRLGSWGAGGATHSTTIVDRSMRKSAASCAESPFSRQAWMAGKSPSLKVEASNLSSQTLCTTSGVCRGVPSAVHAV